MKHILSIAIMLLVTCAADAGAYKVVKSSERSMPKWVSGLTRDHITASATESTIEQAKASVQLSVMQQIAESITTTIRTRTDMVRNDMEKDGNYSYNQTMKSDVRTITDKIPAIREVSISKASAYYWEERYYKKTGVTEFYYAVLYPFSEKEMKKIVLDYEMHQMELDQKLASLEEVSSETINSIDDIDEIISTLSTLQAEFIREDSRFDKCQQLANRYYALYSRITVTSEQPAKGTATCRFLLDGREITISRKPGLKSNCASKLNYRYEGNLLVINYDSSGCYDTDENWIEVRIHTGGKVLVEKIYIK